MDVKVSLCIIMDNTKEISIPTTLLQHTDSFFSKNYTVRLK